MSDRYFDWQRLLSGDDRPAGVVTDSRRRLRWMFAAFLLAVFMILARLWWLEITTGEVVRAQASQPLLREVSIPARRGKIVARDGTILAQDRELRALKLHYRYLEEPPNPGWLTYQARRRLSSAARRDPQRLAAMLAQLRVERAEMHRRLAALAGLTLEEYNAARQRVQTRVQRIARHVNERHTARQADSDEQSLPGWLGWIEEKLTVPPASSIPRRIIVAEELDYHTLVEDLPPESAREIESQPEQFPGVQIDTHRGRVYPQGALAAHVIGHLGALSEEELAEAQQHPGPIPIYEQGDLLGRTGLELAYEQQLRGRRGWQEEQVDRRGETLSVRVIQPAVPGEDLVVTLDMPLQQSAQRLLDTALARHATLPSAGGAAVVLDCRTGAVLASASAPRFDVNVMLRGPARVVSELLTSEQKPLFDRATKMAIPPGSVMKTLTAIALLEAGVIDPRETFYCQGYLHHPSRQRCAIFRHFGVGHDEIDLTQALAQSCNVYFFHHATRLGPRALIDWSERFGLGLPTGIDLPHESRGRVPTPETIEQLEGHPWRTGDTQALSIGQSSLTVTPLQMARLMAAVANDGFLVTPHLLTSQKLPPQRIAGLRRSTLEAVRRGLEQTVFDSTGTAHDTLFLESVPIAAKTGTAETGGNRADHAWIAGYAPADNPRIAFAVALEHSGGGGETAGPVARGLIARMEQLGYFSAPSVAERPRRKSEPR